MVGSALGAGEPGTTDAGAADGAGLGAGLGAGEAGATDGAADASGSGLSDGDRARARVDRGRRAGRPGSLRGEARGRRRARLEQRGGGAGDRVVLDGVSAETEPAPTTSTAASAREVIVRIGGMVGAIRASVPPVATAARCRRGSAAGGRVRDHLQDRATLVHDVQLAVIALTEADHLGGPLPHRHGRRGSRAAIAAAASSTHSVPMHRSVNR